MSIEFFRKISKNTSWSLIISLLALIVSMYSIYLNRESIVFTKKISKIDLSPRLFLTSHGQNDVDKKPTYFLTNNGPIDAHQILILTSTVGVSKKTGKLNVKGRMQFPGLVEGTSYLPILKVFESKKINIPVNYHLNFNLEIHKAGTQKDFDLYSSGVEVVVAARKEPDLDMVVWRTFYFINENGKILSLGAAKNDKRFSKAIVVLEKSEVTVEQDLYFNDLQKVDNFQVRNKQ